VLTVYNGVDRRSSPSVHVHTVWTLIDTIGAVTEPLQDHEVTQDIPETRRFVICGDDTLAYRLADELVNRHKGHVTVIMRSREHGYGPRIAKLDGIRIIEADRPDADAFADADLEEADALALVQRDDVANIDAALSAHEVSPALRQVVRIFNPSLSEGLAQLPYCTVLSDTAMAAPAFVAAATDETTPRVRLRNDTLFVAHRQDAKSADILCGLAITEGRGEPELLPADQNAADLVLVRARRASPQRGRRTPLTHHYPIGAVLGRVWRRVRIILSVFAGLLVLARPSWAGCATSAGGRRRTRPCWPHSAAPMRI